MKKIFMTLIESVIMILPLLCVMLFFYIIINVHYAINVNPNNEKIFREYFTECNINLLEKDIKRIEKKIRIDNLDEFRIIYDDNDKTKIDLTDEESYIISEYIESHGYNLVII